MKSLNSLSVLSKPRHHLYVENPNDKVQWSVFFDLVHVVTIFVLGGILYNHLDTSGFVAFSGLFVAIFFA